MSTVLVVICCIYGVTVALLCGLLAVTVGWDLVRRWGDERRARRRWVDIDREATTFRNELDSLDWAEEMRHYRMGPGRRAA